MLDSLVQKKKRNAGQKLLNKCTAIKSGETHSLTLLQQNHLDHFNNLLQDPWYRKMHVHPCCRLTPVSDRLHARPPVLSPDACKRQAPRFPPRSLTLAHPRSDSQQESARAPVAPGSGRSGAPSAPDQHNIETRFGPNDGGSKRLHVTTTRAGRTK